MSTADMHCSGHSVSIHTDMSLAIIEQCMDGDRHWTAKKLAEHAEISGCTLFQILQ